jgi:hypothetical protein
MEPRRRVPQPRRPRARRRDRVRDRVLLGGEGCVHRASEGAELLRPRVLHRHDRPPHQRGPRRRPCHGGGSLGAHREDRRPLRPLHGESLGGDPVRGSGLCVRQLRGRRGGASLREDARRGAAQGVRPAAPLDRRCSRPAAPSRGVRRPANPALTPRRARSTPSLVVLREHLGELDGREAGLQRVVQRPQPLHTALVTLAHFSGCAPSGRCVYTPAVRRTGFAVVASTAG